MSKKVIGTKYGIEITRPWNNEMYDHNDKVAQLLKIQLRNKLESVYKNGKCTKDELNEVSSIFSYKYGDGFDVKSMYSEIIREVEDLQNYQLAEDIEWYVKRNLIVTPKIGFVGYGK
jgi:uncharacterized protein (UPF0335 family)|tara:strand:+ start:229 stop:579 length:351 start_codon:yes stop_codon:yes gene_type:complete